MRQNPNWAEGIYKKDEKLIFATGMNPPPVPLAHSNVIRTKNTNVVIADAHGSKYEEGIDYSVIDGDLDPYHSMFKFLDKNSGCFL